MPRWHNEEDDEWDRDLDSDEPEECDDLANDGEERTLPCPYCRRAIHEDSVRCPHCESYISGEDAPPSRKPWWIILGVLACLYAIYQWIFCK
jgi:hypothetical protein